MSMIIDSPYEGKHNAEIGEPIFERVNTMLSWMHPTDATFDGLSKRKVAQASKFFRGEALAEIVLKSYKGIRQLEGVVFDSGWGKGKIKGFAESDYVPKRVLLLSLDTRKFADATQRQLEDICSGLDTRWHVQLTLKLWGWRDHFDRLAAVPSTFSYTPGKNVTIPLKCEIFVARAMRILLFIGTHVPEDSLVLKVWACCAIMNARANVPDNVLEEYRDRARRRNASTATAVKLPESISSSFLRRSPFIRTPELIKIVRKIDDSSEEGVPAVSVESHASADNASVSTDSRINPSPYGNSVRRKKRRTSFASSGAVMMVETLRRQHRILSEQAKQMGDTLQRLQQEAVRGRYEVKQQAQEDFAQLFGICHVADEDETMAEGSSPSEPSQDQNHALTDGVKKYKREYTTLSRTLNQMEKLLNDIGEEARKGCDDVGQEVRIDAFRQELSSREKEELNSQSEGTNGRKNRGKRVSDAFYSAEAESEKTIYSSPSTKISSSRRDSSKMEKGLGEGGSVRIIPGTEEDTMRDHSFESPHRRAGIVLDARRRVSRKVRRSLP